MPHLNRPQGGKPIDLFVSKPEAHELKKRAAGYKNWSLSQKQACDVEMLANSGFSLLTGIMNKHDQKSVYSDIHLSNGALLSVPITLDVDNVFISSLVKNENIAVILEKEDYLGIDQ